MVTLYRRARVSQPCPSSAFPDLPTFLVPRLTASADRARWAPPEARSKHASFLEGCLRSTGRMNHHADDLATCLAESALFETNRVRRYHVGSRSGQPDDQVPPSGFAGPRGSLGHESQPPGLFTSGGAAT